jgi:hypothetical protein
MRVAWTFWISPWVTATKVAVVLLAPAVLCVCVGSSDVRSALTFGGRLEGALAVLGAIVLVVGAASAFFYQAGNATAGVVTAVAAMTACVVAVLSLFLVLEQDRIMWLVLGSLALLAAAGWALVRVLRTGVEIPYPKSLAAAVVLPLLIAAGNFVYADVYLPSAQPREVVLTTTIGKPTVSRARGLATIPITIDFKNPSTHKLYVLGSSYSVVGRIVEPADLDLSATNMQTVGPGEELYARNLRIDGFELIQSGRFDQPGSTIEAGGTIEVNDVATVDLPAKYDEIQVIASIILVRADQATISSNAFLDECFSWERDAARGGCVDPSWVANREDAFVRFQAPITEGSRIARLTRHRREVTVWWVLETPTLFNPTGPYLQATIAEPGRESKQPTPGYYRQLSNQYGFQFSESPPNARSLIDMGLPTTSP